MKVLILICMFIYSFQNYYFNDIYLSLASNSFLITSRARNGFSYIAFTKHNSTFKNGLILMNYLDDKGLRITRYEGEDSLNISKKVIPLGNTFVKIFDNSGYPLGRFLYDQTIEFTFNETNIYSNLTLPFWVFVGVNLYSKPNSSVDFNTNFDESNWILIEKLASNVKKLPLPELRLESLHISSYFIALFYFIVVFIISILFANHQPLKSRGVIPRMISIILFIDLLPDFFRLLSFKTYEYHFIILYFFKNPLIASLLILLILRFVRYLILFYLNEKKEDAYFKKDKPTKMQLKFKILKHLGRWYSVTAIYISIFIFMFLFYSITYLILYLSNLDPEVVGVIHVIFVIFVMILNLIIILIDMIRNMISFKLLDLYKKDGLYFRLEFYFIETLSQTFFILLIILSLIFLYIEFLNNMSFIFIQIIVTFCYHSILVKNVLIIVFFTVYHLIKSSNPIEKNKMKKILNNEVAKKYFIEYAKTGKFLYLIFRIFN